MINNALSSICRGCLKSQNQNNMAGRKSSEDKSSERVEFILEMRSKGEKSSTVLMSAWKEKYNLSEGQFRADYSKAKAIIAEYFQKDIEELSNEVSRHLWDLYAKSMKLQDYRECRAILKQITDLAISANVISAARKTVEEKPASPLMALMKKAK